MQGILPKSVLTLEHTTISDEIQISNAIQEMQQHCFDLAKERSLRLKLLSLSKTKHCLVLGYHHIVMDGIGSKTFFSHLDKAYNGLLDIGSNTLQYQDFAARQIREYENGSWSKQIEFWRNQYLHVSPPLPLLVLSRKPARPKVATFDSHYFEFRLEATLKSQIEQCSRHLKITAYHFYLAVFQVLLSRFTDERSNDFCIGVADGNRKDPDVLQSLGLFLNILPLRFHTSPTDTFTIVVQSVKVVSDNAFANSRVPFETILNELQIPRSSSHNLLFQALFNYRRNIGEAWNFYSCDGDGKLISAGQNACDISIDITDSSVRNNLLVFALNKELYTEQDARILGRSYLRLPQACSLNTEVLVTSHLLHHDEDVQAAIEVGRG